VDNAFKRETHRLVGGPKIAAHRTARFTTPVLTRRKREMLECLLDQFASSVNFCIQRCLENGISLRARLHRIAYEEWKAKFNLATHWFHSSGQVATQLLRSWRKLCQNGRADFNKPPVYGARTIRPDIELTNFKGNSLRITIRPGEYLWLPFVISKYHERVYLKDWHEGKMGVGEITILIDDCRANIYMPFKREIKIKPAVGVCGIDVNERSVDLCVIKPSEEPKFIKFDTSKLMAIHHSSQLKRKRIQQKFRHQHKPTQKERLLAKYRYREQNRVNQQLHELSRRIAELIAGENVVPVFENLNRIRERMHFDRDMRRRLNQWPFRRLQTCIEHKVLARGFVSHYVSARFTSRQCPKCGQLNRPNRHRYKCKGCGYEGDRHQVAALNLAKDVARNVPAECCHVKRAVERAVLLMNPPVEAEGIQPSEFQDVG